MQMSQLIPIAVASGVGLLVGIDRERRKGEGPGRRAAGVRTFIIVALLGVLSSSAPALAAGIGALLAIALAAREPLHRLVRQQLSEQEIHDGLLLAACRWRAWLRVSSPVPPRTPPWARAHVPSPRFAPARASRCASHRDGCCPLRVVQSPGC